MQEVWKSFWQKFWKQWLYDTGGKIEKVDNLNLLLTYSTYVNKHNVFIFCVPINCFIKYFLSLDSFPSHYFYPRIIVLIQILDPNRTTDQIFTSNSQGIAFSKFLREFL